MNGMEPTKKKELIKIHLNKCRVLIFIIVIILIPIILNWTIKMPAFFEFVGLDTDWLNFWVTYISAVASFAMVFITWHALKQNDRLLQQNDDLLQQNGNSLQQNDKLLQQNERQLQQNKAQLNEMIRQWDEENKPRLEMYFVKDEIPVKGQRIEIVNIGKNTAKDIKFCIDENIIEKAPNNDTKEALKNICQSFSLLLPNDSIIISLCEDKMENINNHDYKIGLVSVNKKEYSDFYNEIKSMKSISIKGNYNSKYEIDTTISPDIKRNKHKDITDALADIGECIKRLDLMIERKLDTKDNKTNNTIS